MIKKVALKKTVKSCDLIAPNLGHGREASVEHITGLLGKLGSHLVTLYTSYDQCGYNTQDPGYITTKMCLA